MAAAPGGGYPPLNAPPPRRGLPDWVWVLIVLGGVLILSISSCIVCTVVQTYRFTTAVGEVVGRAMEAGAASAPRTTPPPPVLPPPTVAAPVTPPSVPPVAPVNVPIATLLADYNADEGDADRKYKGRALRTAGKIISVRTDVAARTLYTIGTGTGVEINTLQCAVSAAGAPPVPPRIGQRVSARGVCSGRNLTHVVLEDCSVAP